jgi:hypothetical protein
VGASFQASRPELASLAKMAAPPDSVLGANMRTSGISAVDAQTMVYQAHALLGQAQSVLASTQEALLRFQALAQPPQAARPKAAEELNMLSIGLKALWGQFKSLFGRRT